VGYSNTHLFVGFLAVNILVLTYSSYLHYLIFSTQVANIRRLQRETIAALGPMLQSVKLRTTTQLYWAVILEAELGGALYLVSLMISVVTVGFMAHHVWLMSTGTTTNESFKWADVKDALACGQICILDQDDPYMYRPPCPPSSPFSRLWAMY
jgi:palmitoyltransferase